MRKSSSVRVPGSVLNLNEHARHRIRSQYSGWMVDLKTNRLHFETDPDPGLDTGWIFRFLQHEVIGIFRRSIYLLIKLWMNVSEIFCTGKEQSVGIWDSSESGSIFPLFRLWETEFLGSKDKLKELLKNGWHFLDNERRWRRFELRECLLVFKALVYRHYS